MRDADADLATDGGRALDHVAGALEEAAASPQKAGGQDGQSLLKRGETRGRPTGTWPEREPGQRRRGPNTARTLWTAVKVSGACPF